MVKLNFISAEVFMSYNKLYLAPLFPLLLATVFSKAAEKEPAKDQLTIMSFNIRRKGKEKGPDRLWQNRLPLIKELLEEANPDIIGFQEVTKKQREDLMHTLPNNFKYVGTGRGASWAGLGTDEATPIFYNTEKFELKEHETYQLNKASMWKWMRKRNEYGYLPRICTWANFTLKDSDKQLYVFNTHLDHKSEKARLNQLKNILKKTEAITDCPVFIMGDFNTDLVEPIQKELSNHNYVNTKEETVHRSGPKETYTGWQDEPEKLIDHILVKNGKNNKSLRITKYEVIKKEDSAFPSDHRPVLIQVSL